MRKAVAVAVLLLAGVAPHAPVRAQSPSPTAEPAFEVASLKMGTAGIVYSPTYGRNTWTVGDAPLQWLLATAFDYDGKIVNGPDWLRSEAYTIDAKAEDGVRLTRENIRPLLQHLLAERFKLVAHIETTYESGYALVVAKGGPKPTLAATEKISALSQIWPNRIRAFSVNMPTLAKMISTMVQAPVGDETGLAGNFEFTMTFAVPPPFGPPDAPLPSIFTALDEQLGLKLEGSRRVPVRTLVIDHVEHPMAD